MTNLASTVLDVIGRQGLRSVVFAAPLGADRGHRGPIMHLSEGPAVPEFAVCLPDGTITPIFGRSGEPDHPPMRRSVRLLLDKLSQAKIGPGRLGVAGLRWFPADAFVALTQSFPSLAIVDIEPLLPPDATRPSQHKPKAGLTPTAPAALTPQALTPTAPAAPTPQALTPTAPLFWPEVGAIATPPTHLTASPKSGGNPQTEAVASDPLTSDPLTPDPVTPDPVTPDPVTPDPATPDPVASQGTISVPAKAFGRTAATAATADLAEPPSAVAAPPQATSNASNTTPAQPDTDYSGVARSWKLEIDTPMGTHQTTLTMFRGGGGFYRSTAGEAPLEDLLDEDDHLTFRVPTSGPMGDIVLRFDLLLEGNQLHGTVTTPVGLQGVTGVQREESLPS